MITVNDVSKDLCYPTHIETLVRTVGAKDQEQTEGTHKKAMRSSRNTDTVADNLVHDADNGRKGGNRNNWTLDFAKHFGLRKRLDVIQPVRRRMAVID